MKKLILLPVLLIGFLLCGNVNAQVSVGINIGLQPIWGPVGYDHADYYYMPDIDAYYDIPNHQFIYLEGGRWVFGAALPPRFHYDLYSGYKVVVNEPRPWIHPEVYRSRYAGYRGRHDQVIIRNSHEPKYFEIKEHPEHAKWKGRTEVKHEEHREEHGKR